MQRAPNELQLKLPAKITGIVFWGLAFVGLFAAVLLLDRIETSIYNDYQNNIDSLSYEIEEIVESTVNQPVLEDAAVRLKRKLAQLQKKMKFTHIYMKSGDSIVTFGEKKPDDDVYSRTINYFNSKLNVIEEVKLYAYFPGKSKEIAGIRKNMLLTVGLSLFLFGFLLQKILQRVISAPFVEMVETAQKFTEGNESVRFNEIRRDEFGYLGRFINNAIESVLLQQEEIVIALERATRTEIELGLEKERAEVTLHSLTDAVITVDMDERIQYINPASEKLLGVTSKDIKRMFFKDVINIIDESSGNIIRNPLHECFLSGEIIKLPEHSSIINGESAVVAIEASVAPMKTDMGDMLGAVMIIQDVSHTRTLTRQLSHQASHDMLTGLYNRRKFEEHLEEILHDVRIENRYHSLCYLDLDQFKIVNDTCGHVAGDELLQQLPSLFNKVLRTGDIIARLGGDEFGILLENCNIKQASEIADKIRQQIKDFRFIWEGKSFEIGVSIGVVGIDVENTNLAKIMSSADVACYAAKDAGRNRVHVYEPSDEIVSERYGEMHWTGRITQAIEDERFHLYQQAIVSTSEDGVKHVEILLRMQGEEGNIIPPGAFIPAAERYNLMAGVDRWVISKVFQSISEHIFNESSVNNGGLLSINLSGESLNDDTLLDFILSEKDKYDVSLTSICFEITETVAISNLNKATRFINKLKNYGCSFSLDDFGSGLSSFAYLKKLPVRFLKIDGSFVKNIKTDEIDRAMVQSIQQVGSVMKLKTIAERVEDEATLKILKEIGVDYVQGYYLGRPEFIV